MANPYQQSPGGYGAPQYYVPGAIYPGGYYGAPQGYMAAPAAGQPYGVNIYGMPTAVPQYQVAQQPTVVAVPQVRAMANPLDSMFGAKPSAAPAIPVAVKPAAPSALATPLPSLTPSISTPTEFGSFASAPPATRPAPAPGSVSFMSAAPAPILTPSPFVSPSAPSAPSMWTQPMAAAAPSRTADDDFGGFVSAAPVAAPKPAPLPASPYTLSPAPAPVAPKPAPPVAAPVYAAPTLAPFAAAPPSTAAATAAPPALAVPPVSTAPKPAPPAAATPPAFSASAAPSAAPKPAPPVATAPPMPAPAPPPSASASAADDARHPKTSKKAVDWSRVNYADVFANIEQENALAAQFTPVAPAPAAQAQDEWGSFQAPASSPAPASLAPQVARPAPSASMPGSMGAPPAPAAPSASMPGGLSAPLAPAAPSAADWGPMMAATPAPAPSPAPTGSFAGASSFPHAAFTPAASALPTPPAASAASLLPPSSAQTASALFSSFSGFPASSPLAAVVASNPATALRSTAPPNFATTAAAALAGAASSYSALASSFTGAAVAPRPASTSDVDFGDFVSTPSAAPTPSPAPAPASLPSSSASVAIPSSAAVSAASPARSFPSLGASPVFSSFSFKHSAPPASAPAASPADDFGEFASAAPVVAAKPPAPAAQSHNTPSSPLTPFGASVSTPPAPSAIEFGDFAAPSPAPTHTTLPPPAPPLKSQPPAPSAVDFGDFSSPLAMPTSAHPAPLSASPVAPSALATATPSIGITAAPAPAPPPVHSPLNHSLLASTDSAAFAPFAQLSPAPAASPAVPAVADDEWGGFETAKPAAPAPLPSAPSAPAATAMPKSAEPPRPMLTAEALLGRAMRVLDTRNDDDFGSFASASLGPAPAPAPAAKPSANVGGTGGGGFGFLFAGPPLASPLAASPGSPMVATARPARPASDALTDVLAFLVQHERLEEAQACRAAMDGRPPSDEQLARWRSAAPPAGHLTAEEMRKQLGAALGAAVLEKYAAKFGDLSDAARTDLAAAAAQQRQAHALFKRLLATKGADLTDARRAALQAIAAELTAAQDFASLVLLKSSLAGAEEEAVKRGVWGSAKGAAFFRGLSELHLVFRRITQALSDEGSDLMLAGLQASVAVAWNTLLATLASEAKRIEQDAPLLTAKDAGSVCSLCGLPAPAGASLHSSCSNLQKHAATAAGARH